MYVNSKPARYYDVCSEKSVAVLSIQKILSDLRQAFRRRNIIQYDLEIKCLRRKSYRYFPDQRHYSPGINENSPGELTNECITD